jgi:WD40 repeat protein
MIAGLITAVRYSPDGKYLAVAHSLGVDLWDARGKAVARRLDGHQRGVKVIDFSRDGSKLVSGAEDGAVVWNVLTGNQICKMEKVARVDALAFNPQKPEVAALRWGNEVVIWNPETGRQLRTLQGVPNGTMAIAYSPDGTMIAAAGHEVTVKLWNAETGEVVRTLEGHTKPTLAVAFSPDGRRLATSSEDETIRLWEVNSGKPLRVLGPSVGKMRRLYFSRDGALLAGAGDRPATIWNADKGDELVRLTTYAGDLSFSPDGETIAVTDTSSGAVNVEGVRAGERVRRIEGYCGSVGDSMAALAFVRSQPAVLILPHYQSLRQNFEVCDLYQQQVLKSWPQRDFGDHPIFTPDGKKIATSYVSGGADSRLRIRLWDIQPGSLPEVLLECPAPTKSSPVLALDSRHLAFGCVEGLIRILELKTKRMVAEIKGITRPALAFSPDEKLLAYCPLEGTDDAIHLCSSDSGEERYILKAKTGGVRAIAFSPDGRFLAAGGADKSVRLLPIGPEGKEQVLRGHTNEVRSVAFSPDGAELASAGTDATIRLWNCATGQQVQTLTGHRDQILCLSFSGDGRFLASSSSEGTVRIWLKQAARKPATP